MPGDRPQLSAETLSRIMLLQGMMGQLPDEGKICGFVCQGLQDLPGVERIRHEPGSVAVTPSARELVLAVEVGRQSFGSFIVTLADPTLFAPYEDYIRNLCFMVAVVLEERRQRAAYVAYQKELELRVEERTRQLVEEAAIREAAERRAIAERQRAEEYLRVAEVIIVELDCEGRIQRINPRGCTLLGRSQDQLVGCNWFETTLPADQGELVQGAFRQIMAGQIEALAYFDSDIVDASGNRYHIAWHNVLRRGDDGRCTGTLSSGLDVTERELAEQTLAAEKENLAVTLRSIGDAVITTDIDGNVVLMNEVAEHMTGFTQSEAAGRPLPSCFRIVHEHTRDARTNPAEKVLVCNQIVELEPHTILIARDGREYAIADSCAPIRASDGSVRGVVLVFRDMTEKYRMMDVAQRSDRLESLGILAGGIAHDFNNLLGGIYGYVELAQLDATDPIVQRNLAAAGQTIDRARGLTRQLLTFAKGGAPVKRDASLLPVIRENARFALSGTHVSSHVDLPDDLWNCTFDPAQVSQVLDNLLINAVQAMPHGGSIEIKARNVALVRDEIPMLAAGPHVKIEIRDTGVGIPPALHSRIFDPFFTTKKSGNGLGLATAFSIMKRHDGTILVASQPGQGTTFTLYLPAAPTVVLASASSKRSRHRGHGSILLMDDERAVLDVTAQFLSSLGYRVLPTRDGQEAIDLFVRTTQGEHDIVAVILDMTVPGGLGGKEAAASIRQRHPSVPIFLVSGYAHDPIMATPHEHGFTDSLCKPFSRDQLIALLEKHCQGRDAV